MRGRVDVAVVMLLDLFVALPALVRALVIIVMIGSSLQNLAITLGLVMGPTVARLARG